MMRITRKPVIRPVNQASLILSREVTPNKREQRTHPFFTHIVHRRLIGTVVHFASATLKVLLQVLALIDTFKLGQVTHQLVFLTDTGARFVQHACHETVDT